MTLTDVTVTISVKKPSPSAGFGIPAVFVPGQSNSYKEYSTSTAVLVDYAATTSTAKFAMEFFNQVGHPPLIAVITYADITAAYNLYVNKPWYFAILAKEGITALHPQLDTNILTLSNLIEAAQYRLLFVLDSYAATDTIQDAKTLLGNVSGNTRTVILVKKINGAETDAERFDAALIGLYGAKTVGTLNWHDLIAPDLTADDWDAVSLAVIGSSDVIAFTYKSNNVAQTTSGETVTGAYIDQIMGIDWTAHNIQASLQNILTNNDKVPYNASGFALLQSVVENVLLLAYQNGIIDTDDVSGKPLYSVSTEKRSQLQAADVADRVYNGLSYQYTPSGAIDTVNVIGTIEL